MTSRIKTKNLHLGTSHLSCKTLRQMKILEEARVGELLFF